jgi:hypothetical protein
MWEFVWKIEEELNTKYKGPDEYHMVSEWISDHVDKYYEALAYPKEDFDLDVEY